MDRKNVGERKLVDNLCVTKLSLNVSQTAPKQMETGVHDRLHRYIGGTYYMVWIFASPAYVNLVCIVFN